jgi:acyl phosphate:glycerol-3-phosphate acyltransferase
VSSLEAIAAIAGAYLLGGIPFALLLGFVIGRVDIRKRGSGNVGATNLGRVCGWRYFPVAFLLDFAKGFVPLHFLAPAEGQPEAGLPPLLVTVSLALAPVLGHLFSPFLRFRGGKGVATGAGAMTALVPLETGIAGAVWLAAFALTRTVGVASSAAAVALPAAFFIRWPAHAPDARALIGSVCVLTAALVLYRHRSNLRQFFARNRKET